MRDGWSETTLGDVAEWWSGGTPKAREPKYYENGTIPWAVIADMNKGIINSTNSYITEDALDLIGGRLAPVGSVLISMYASVGKSAIANIPLATNQAIAWSIPNQEKINPFYLYLVSQQLEKEISDLARGATQRNINRQMLREFTFQLPPLPEQKRIVDLISSVDSYIEALQQQLDSAKRSRNAVLHKLLTVGGEDWEYKILSDICEVRDGTHDSPKPSDKGFALVTSKNIKDGRLDLESAYLISPQDYEEVNKRSKVEQYNLLISMIGTIGEVIVVEGEPDFAIKNVGLLKSTEPILSRYLCHYLGSQLGKNAISLSVSGSTQKFISLGKLRALPVLYPSMEDQKAIVEAMSLFDQQISKNLEVAARIKNLRSSLLSDLLSGEHEIPASYDKVIGAA